MGLFSETDKRKKIQSEEPGLYDTQLHFLSELRLRLTPDCENARAALRDVLDLACWPKRRFAEAQDALAKGASFSKIFSILDIGSPVTDELIKAGEDRGDLKNAVAQIIRYMEEKRRRKGTIVKALKKLLPGIIILLCWLWETQFGFIPFMRLQGAKSTDPAVLARFQEVVESVALWNGLLLFFFLSVLLTVGIFCGLLWKNRHDPQLVMPKMFLKYPAFSMGLRNIDLNDSFWTLSFLLRVGLSLQDAVRIVLQNLDSPVARTYWSKAKKTLDAGQAPGVAFSAGLIDECERVRMARVQSVDQIADLYEAMALRRSILADKLVPQIENASFFFLFFIGGATILINVYLLMQQNITFLNLINEIRG